MENEVKEVADEVGVPGGDEEGDGLGGDTDRQRGTIC